MTELNFFDSSYQYVSSQRTFGLCDDVPPPHRPAYIDESNGNNWIAVVENANQLAINFIALDHTNIVLKKTDGQNDRCCDGCLNYNTTIIFVELTISKGRNWRKDKYEQLRITISHFEKTAQANNYTIKKAYISNKLAPFKQSYMVKMEKFLIETSYDLRIDNRIIIE